MLAMRAPLSFQPAHGLDSPRATLTVNSIQGHVNNSFSKQTPDDRHQNRLRASLHSCIKNIKINLQYVVATQASSQAVENLNCACRRQKKLMNYISINIAVHRSFFIAYESKD